MVFSRNTDLPESWQKALKMTALIALSATVSAWTRGDENDYRDFGHGRPAEHEEWVEAIKIVEPMPRTAVSGATTVKFAAPGMDDAWALCWSQPTDGRPGRWGHDIELTPHGIKLDKRSQGEFIFPAEKFPHGPSNIRIYATNGAGERDVFELQLYNTGGVSWNEGVPDAAPAAAAGMELVYCDDFDGPLSIGGWQHDGEKYYSHKPGGGDFSGWRFGEPPAPFEQVDTYLRIKARKHRGEEKGYTGLIASVDGQFEGFLATPPCYLECRLTAQSAPGTWPAFWTLTHSSGPTDELDICELYGGNGEGNPNLPGYTVWSHFWKQTTPDGALKKHPMRMVPIMELGGKSYWSTTFHTYGVRIGRTDTVYYYDDIEVFRHPTNELSLSPHFFMINYAIGGSSGWKIDLERYGNGSDMYVDYVRVYEEK